MTSETTNLADAVKQLQEARHQLELEIGASISSAMANFEKKTGVRVIDLDVQLFEFSYSNSAERGAIVGNVNVKLDI